MPQLTRDHLRALLEHQRGMLRGESYGEEGLELAGLGPLAPLVADTNGWRRDGTAITRRFLAAMIDGWEAAQPASTGPDPTSRLMTLAENDARAAGRRVAPAHEVAETVRRYAGVIEPPPPTMAKLARERGVDPGTARTWPDRVLSVAEAERLCEEFVSDGNVPARLTGSPADWRGSPNSWPPAGDVDLVGDRELLFDRLRAVVPDLAGGGDGTQRLGAIRRFAADLTRDYLTDPSLDIARDVDRGVLDVWDDEDVLLFGTAQGPEKKRGRLPRAVVAIVQMFCFEATHEAPGRRDELTALFGARQAGLRFVSRAEAGTRRAQLGRIGRTARESVALDLRRRGRATEPLVKSSPVLKDFHGPGPLGASEALQVSNYLRNRSDAEKSVLLEIYVGKREKFADGGLEFTSKNNLPVARMQYALADQGVDLEILNIEDGKLAERMERVINAYSGSYGILSPRNRALAANKEGAYARAVELVENVYQTAKKFILDRTISDPIEQLETLHQISLAATGILTATVETRLASRRSPNDAPLAEYIISLLNWSAQMRDYLRELTRLEGGLPSVRHEDERHIVWRGWALTTAQNRLRALIVAHTAWAAVPGIALPRGADYDIGLDAVLDAYREVVVDPHISTSSGKVLVMQATWLAFLNGGKLPAVRTGISRVLANIRLLDDAPSGMSVDDPTLTFRHRASAQWHIDRGDGGKLAELRRDSLAWAHLRATGGDAFEEWYALVDAAGLTPRPGDLHA